MSTMPQDFSTIQGAEPAWAIATLFPPQGSWSVNDYLEVSDETNRLIEFSHGEIEVLEMPTTAHQLILSYLLSALKDFVLDRNLGIVAFAALRLKISETVFREPDIIFAHKNHREYVQSRFWTGADLVMEIVSDDAKSRRRDLVDKRLDYAAAGVGEYWIVDPAERRITVLVLEGNQYATHGEFAPGQQAASRLLEGFSVDVAAVLEAANG
jgi:Uma2 family endonuclease